MNNDQKLNYTFITTQLPARIDMRLIEEDRKGFMCVECKEVLKFLDEPCSCPEWKKA